MPPNLRASSCTVAAPAAYAMCRALRRASRFLQVALAAWSFCTCACRRRTSSLERISFALSGVAFAAAAEGFGRGLACPRRGARALGFAFADKELMSRKDKGLKSQKEPRGESSLRVRRPDGTAGAAAAAATAGAAAAGAAGAGGAAGAAAARTAGRPRRRRPHSKLSESLIAAT